MSFCVPIFSMAQTVHISVFDKQQGYSLPNAHVTVKHLHSQQSQILICNKEGKAAVPDDYLNKQVVLSAHYLGYVTQTDTLMLHTSLNFYLDKTEVLLNEVVVTAQYAPNSPDKSVQKIRIIDSKKIESMAAVNLRDLLSNELNIRLSQDNILGSSMSLQGISGENVKILIDGVPIIGRLNGNIDLSQINLNEIERIELIEGPLSVNYGTNALAGTINIITKKTKNKKNSVSLSSYNENIGNFNQHMSYFGNHQNHNYSLSAGRNFFDGWNPDDKFFSDFKPTIADSNRFKQWKPKEQLFGRINYQYSFKKHQVGIKSEFFNEKITNRGLPISPYKETAFDDFYYTKRIDNVFFANGNFNPNIQYNSIISYNYFDRIKNTYFKDLTTLNKELSTQPESQDTSVFTLAMARGSFIFQNDTNKINFELGYDLNYENAYGKKIINQQQSMGDYALFSTAEIKPFNKLIIKPGFRYTYNTNYKAPLIPSLNVLYRLNAFSIRASYARGFRAPSLKELYFYFVDINHNIVGNNNLAAEASNNYSLNIQHKKIFKQVIVQNDAGVFYNDIRNLITLAQINNQEYSYINIGFYKTQGFNFNSAILFNHFKFNSGFAYIGRYNILHQQFPETQAYLYYPEIRVNAIYEWKKINAALALFYKYQGRFNSFSLDANNNVYNTFINDYQIADVTISKKFFKQKLMLSSGVKNIFNVSNVAANMAGGVHSSAAFASAVATGRLLFFKIDIHL